MCVYQAENISSFTGVGHGAMAWDAFILVYSLAGGIFLYRYGAYFYFDAYE